MNTTTAVILGGGKSSRFFPFSSKNKSAIFLAGKSLFERTIESVKKSGVQKIIVIDDQKNSLETLLKDSEKKDIIFIAQKSPKGMGDALLLARDKISEDNFFVLSSYHFEFNLFADEMKKAIKKNTDLAIIVKNDDDSSQFGGVSFEDGKLKVYEKSNIRFERRIISIYLLNKEFLNVLSEQQDTHYNFESALSNYNLGEIFLLEAKAPTLSLKFPWDTLFLKDYILSDIQGYKAKNAEIDKSAKIEGNVYISENVKIKHGAVILGPAFIGNNAYIGTNAILRKGVIIENNVVIGAGMEVKNSIIMKGSKTHSGFIGDSIIGENVKIGAGLISGNVRLDRKEITVEVKNEKINTRMKYLGCFIGEDTVIGINVGIMPGIIIGRKAVIGPGTTVMKNVMDKVKYYTEFKEVIEKL